MQELLPLAERIGTALKARGETIAIAESSTGGLISAALLSVSGASAYFRGGGVIYTAQARLALLGIPEPLPAPVERAATQLYAELLATTARDWLDATWGLGETGAAGPDGNRYGDPAGHTWVALAGPTATAANVRTGSSDRVFNMREFARQALELLAAALDA
ncbi:CinA family protein [Acidisoma sp.]|uniref:CinA family protein n=1 Tax=Acidisoma sp. TaxID=1872115 RepID=UPI003B007582